MTSESGLETLHSKAADSAGEMVYRASPLPPGTRLDNFHIDHLIDESPAGYTYSANDGRLIIQEYFPQQSPAEASKQTIPGAELGDF